MQSILNFFHNFLARSEPSADEQYLAEAVDLIDLEYRMRQLDDHRGFNAGAFRLSTLQR